jgi:hypothetical protein
MSEPPFLVLVDEEEERRVLCVPPGHEGFVRHETGRLRLGPGVHRLHCGRALAVFLVQVEGAHRLDLKSLGGAMVRAANGRWRPLKVLGHLAYGIARPEQLVDFLEREQIHEAHELEHELARLSIDLLANVFDGEALQADRLAENLEVVSGELLRRLTAIVLPLGLRLDGLDLLAAPAPLDGVAAPGAA